LAAGRWQIDGAGAEILLFVIGEMWRAARSVQQNILLTSSQTSALGCGSFPSRRATKIGQGFLTHILDRFRLQSKRNSAGLAC
jgi:hypothetical protein